MNIKKRFQSTKIPGCEMRERLGRRLVFLAEGKWDVEIKNSFSFKWWMGLGFGFATVFVLAISPFMFGSGGGGGGGMDFGVETTLPVGSSLLIAECGDRDYLNSSADYILEGTITEVQAGYADLEIEKYVKGEPFAKDVLRINTPVGPDGMSVWVEDQAVFKEGAQIRIYLMNALRYIWA
jgi:hypothetical protein